MAGTLGVQSATAADGRLRLEAWFPLRPSRSTISEMPPGVELEVEETVPDADWFATWRERAQPFPVGRTLYLDPREPEDATPRSPMAGACSACRPAPRSAPAATNPPRSPWSCWRTPISRAGGCSTSAPAPASSPSPPSSSGRNRWSASTSIRPSPFHARDNSALNGLHPRLFAGRLAALRERPRFDLALVNVVPEQILPEMPASRRPPAPRRRGDPLRHPRRARPAGARPHARTGFRGARPAGGGGLGGVPGWPGSSRWPPPPPGHQCPGYTGNEKPAEAGRGSPVYFEPASAGFSFGV